MHHWMGSLRGSGVIGNRKVGRSSDVVDVDTDIYVDVDIYAV